MDPSVQSSGSDLGAVVRRLAWMVGAIAWALAAAVGLVIALCLAATVVATAFFASACLALAGAVLKARRALRRSADPTLIEARNVGGHSWVAYGWDGRS